MKTVKVVLWAILLIIIGLIFHQNSIMRKKAARSKAKAEKIKHQSRMKSSKGVVTSLQAQIKIATKRKGKNKAELKILKVHQKKVKNKIVKDLKNIEKTNSDITTLNSAISYAEKLKKRKGKR